MSLRALSLLVALLAAPPLAMAQEDGLSERVDLLLDQLTTGGLSLSRSATIALQAMGEEGRRVLLDRLESGDPLQRRRAVEGLAALGKARGAESIMGLVDDRDAGVRAAAVGALGRLRVEGAFGAALASLGDTSGSVRAAGVLALADLGSAQAIKPILGLAGDPDADVRGAVAYAVGRLGDRSAGSLLCLKALSRDENGGVRRKAALSLGEVGNRYVVEDLVFGLADDDPWVRGASARALGRLASRGVLLPPAVPSGGDAVLRQAQDAALRRAQDAALLKLRGLCVDDESCVRASAAEALGELGDAASLQDLARLLDDDSPSGIYLFTSMRELSVAEVAASSLGRITGDSLGYERGLPQEKRDRALERWRRWREKTVEGSKLKVKGKE